MTTSSQVAPAATPVDIGQRPSSSPFATSASPSSSYNLGSSADGTRRLPPHGSSPTRSMSITKSLQPFDTAAIKVLLLENVNETAVRLLKGAGYQVEHHTKALPEDLLREKIRGAHVIGIRSKTKLTADILKEAKNLAAIGCFCIGTNQVDLEYAASRGISVFNSPFSNSRSVAELVLAEVIALSRHLTDKNTEMHAHVWNKPSAEECFEIRGKKLGIVGYGHIGSQLSVLAESFGMTVLFYDVQQMMPLGTAQSCASLEELLQTADFVTLHVPETQETKELISSAKISLMKKGSYLINASRGTVVVLPDLVKALQSGHIAGAAVDVYPKEPLSNGMGFATELQGSKNVILTPHIGGSTEEAQSSIGVEVATALMRFINTGTTLGAVNFPESDLRAPVVTAGDLDQRLKVVRILNVHQNVPGVLKQINRILSDYIIDKQICDSKGNIAYLMVDVSGVENEDDLRRIWTQISAIGESIVTRVVY